MATSVEPIPPARSAGRLWLWGGLVLAILGIPLFVVQQSLQRLFVPWYIPILTTLGALSVVVAFARRKSALRGAVLGLLVAWCAFQWYALGVLVRLPEYTGPAVAMKKLTAFTTVTAGGAPFTERDLEAGPATVLVFFRGRW